MTLRGRREARLGSQKGKSLACPLSLFSVSPVCWPVPSGPLRCGTALRRCRAQGRGPLRKPPDLTSPPSPSTPQLQLSPLRRFLPSFPPHPDACQTPPTLTRSLTHSLPFPSIARLGKRARGGLLCTHGASSSEPWKLESCAHRNKWQERYLAELSSALASQRRICIGICTWLLHHDALPFPVSPLPIHLPSSLHGLASSNLDACQPALALSLNPSSRPAQLTAAPPTSTCSRPRLQLGPRRRLLLPVYIIAIVIANLSLLQRSLFALREVDVTIEGIETESHRVDILALVRPFRSRSADLALRSAEMPHRHWSARRAAL
ncbi:hypothetical protein PCL_02920 [Purpureocillium lilacinum]|uniref:Uncharacterized protein n=1 Tax=Purpureocillium lilacinum TaxID=33203 RepID=A0A2U3DZB8_PURLI|nr:hypothetical protein PCL_02920 [Purpureocillium lilacinum]